VAASGIASPRIFVLAGVNGAGKSSIAGAAFRNAGADYYNPDEAARRLRAARPALSQREANSLAWQQGKRLLEQAIAGRLDFAFESTLGASTIPSLLRDAASRGLAVNIWYVGLSSAELHLARVRSRVARGGHDIPEADIRRRYEHSRLNLIDLLPHVAALRMYDNSVEADPAAGKAPELALVLHMEKGKILNAGALGGTPEWAKPVVAAAMKMRTS
jgi:predicted ABC-type ATPase